MTSYMFRPKEPTVDYRKIGVRALVTAAEMFLGLILVSSLSELTVDKAEVAALSAVGAGLSVIYNALRQWLDTDGIG